MFDYENGCFPDMDVNKTIFIFASYGHSDYYNAEIFSLLADKGMQYILAVLSDNIEVPGYAETAEVKKTLLFSFVYAIIIESKFSQY
ncbi:MAG: hypothetical protein E7384_05520 [Ruminococcaceae bacterium]|nr:hypothetical protein [Oscillospiraceae bacterium]